ncbi:MAG: signal peptidase I [Treponema sp.]|nr:signal peptidase I [Treponema sp.]
MNTKKLAYLTVGLCVSSAIFSLTMISFHADVSLAAFPLSLVFTFFTAAASIKKLFKEKNLYFISVYRELLQYLPYVLLVSFVLRRAGAYGTPYILDVFSVVFWILTSLFVLVVLHFLNPKKIGKIDKEWEKYIEQKKSDSSKKQPFSLKKFFKEILSWIDALVQAVFMVLLLNIFIVQLYEIPSESMVPEFLIKDRVVVFKTLSGPKFPLSEIGLPYVKKYSRGDIVVFRNPHYSNDRKSEVKTFISQLVYMCTLTKVNLNVESDGNPKADPLVKRVCGVSGEQLMMQDGVLYSRKKGESEFKAVQDDAKWAAWNLNEVRPNLKSGIMDFPLSQNDYDAMLKLEEERRNLDIESVKAECFSLASQFENYSKQISSSKAALFLSELENFYSSSKNGFSDTFSSADKNVNEYELFDRNELVTAKLLSSKDGAVWFRNFMTSWAKNDIDFAGDLYSEANFRLNLMIKLVFGRLAVENLKEFDASASLASLRSAGEKIALLEKAQILHSYVYLLDRRNMPIFPANDSDGNPVYIPENSYFMMGDNRFNSLDMRHSYDYWLAPISKYDDYSATYYSDMQPQYVSRNRMLGNTSYRFWPVSRAGKPGLTGK